MPSPNPTAVKFAGLLVALGLFGMGPGTALMDEMRQVWRHRKEASSGDKNDRDETAEEQGHAAEAALSANMPSSTKPQTVKPEGQYEPLVLPRRYSTHPLTAPPPIHYTDVEDNSASDDDDANDDDTKQDSVAPPPGKEEKVITSLPPASSLPPSPVAPPWFSLFGSLPPPPPPAKE